MSQLPPEHVSRSHYPLNPGEEVVASGTLGPNKDPNSDNPTFDNPTFEPLDQRAAELKYKLEYMRRTGRAIPHNTVLNQAVRQGQDSDKIELRTNLIVKQTIYHQPPDENPTSFETSYQCWLDSDEQPYGPRRERVGIEWQQINLNWLNDKPISVLTIVNLEGVFTIRIPSEQQLNEAAGRILEVARGVVIEGKTYYIPIGIIRAKRHMTFEPPLHSKLFIRSKYQEARYHIYATPG